TDEFGEGSHRQRGRTETGVFFSHSVRHHPTRNRMGGNRGDRLEHARRDGLARVAACHSGLPADPKAPGIVRERSRSCSYREGARKEPVTGEPNVCVNTCPSAVALQGSFLLRNMQGFSGSARRPKLPTV